MSTAPAPETPTAAGAPTPGAPASPRVPWGPVAGLALGLAAAVAAGFALLLQHGRGPLAQLRERQPGMDRAAKAGQAAGVSPLTLGKLIPGTGTPAPLPGAWPGFRGPGGDNIATDTTALARSWPAAGPKKLWSVELGEGFAGAAVLNGRIYLTDYDMAAQADAIRCLSLADAREIWRYTYPVRIKRYHGISRTVPAVTGKYVVSLGPKCHVACVDAVTGAFVWGHDLVKEFNAEVPPWYAGQCPRIDGGRVILATGGDALLVAVDLATGQVLWKSPNPRDWKMTHSSVVPMEFAGKRMYLYCGSGGVAGVSADDGRLLWDTEAWVISIATVASPLPAGDGKIFLSGGYNAGSLMLQLKESGGKLAAEPLFRLKPTEFGATQHTPILYEGHLYGVRPDGQLTCLGLDGKSLWTSGAAARFGLGPFLIAGGLILAMNDEGRLTLAEAGPKGYRSLAQARILNGQDSWAPMALAGSRLLARDMTQMVCLDVGDGSKP